MLPISDILCKVQKESEGMLIHRKPHSINLEDKNSTYVNQLQFYNLYIIINEFWHKSDK